ncbi:hypothetical protein [Streptomyces sp. NPDC006668]|uniref:hypothetical protein n=1 Tax=Streptomyces sp. NPDC006668 TaxID=3156903 RepID=UPI003409E5C4
MRVRGEDFVLLVTGEQRPVRGAGSTEHQVGGGVVLVALLEEDAVAGLSAVALVARGAGTVVGDGEDVLGTGVEPAQGDVVGEGAVRVVVAVATTPSWTDTAWTVTVSSVSARRPRSCGVPPETASQPWGRGSSEVF